MIRIRADLHIHSCVSPCASLTMSPRSIADYAKKAGLHAVGLTDHNTAANAPAFEKCCLDRDLIPVFGMEVESREEAHLLAFFPSLETCMEFSAWIYGHLSAFTADATVVGDQVYVDQDENILGNVEKFLGQSTDLDYQSVMSKTHALGGLFVPAHVDRPVFSLPSQLGFLPKEAYDAVEITDSSSQNQNLSWPLLASSDAHYLEDIARRYTEIEVHSPDAKGILDAISAGRVACNFPKNS